MVQFLQLVVSGLAMGCVLGLIALGFTLIYKATETVNFAQGDLMMLGGFVALTAVAIARPAVLAGRRGGDRGHGRSSAPASSAWRCGACWGSRPSRSSW